LVYVSPDEIKNPEETSGVLAGILNLDKNSILEKIKKDSFYELIKKKITKEELAGLKEANLPGVYLGQESGRYYPFGVFASQVVGFLGGNGKGQYGIEGYYDDILQGKEKNQELEKGPGGYLTSKESFSFEKGADIVLTLDYNIQFMAEKLLQQAKGNLDIKEGEIIVIDPNSGKILALANFPSFNPNQYSEVSDLEMFQNSSIQKVFEPGSVFKPFTMASALDQGEITPRTTYVDKGFVEVGGHVISNYDGHVWGERTMNEVLERSINTGAVFAEQQLDHSVFLDYIKRFGIFEPTEIDLQGEVCSPNKEFKTGHEINFATASFGQGIEMTSLQLVRAMSVIANGGKLVKPYIVDKISENGKITQTQPQIQNPSVIQKSTASQVALMMVNVVEQGYGKEARIPGYYVAGKTGTAQVAWSALKIDKRGYSGKTIQSFVGFAPALDPQFLILVKLYDPKAKTAEYSAAPIFKELAKYIIDLRQIPPERE
jgi:cell division protein FtsI/penicillin-binding protein 2